MPTPSPFMLACDDVVTVITAAITAGGVFSETIEAANVKRRWRPRKELARLVDGVMHVAIIPSIAAQSEYAARNLDRWQFGVQFELHGKLNLSGADVDSDDGTTEIDRWDKTAFELLTLLRSQSKLAHGAQRGGDVARITYNRSPRMLDQRCFSAAYELPFWIEVAR